MTGSSQTSRRAGIGLPATSSATVPAKAREVELKLLAAPEDLARIAELELVRDTAQAPPTRHREHTTYFDTPQLDLARRGLALRIRRDGARRVQAVKTIGSATGDAAAVAIRGEWEWQVTCDGPDLTPLRQGELTAVIPSDVPDRLVPVFTTDVQRTRIQLLAGGRAEVELALDQGQVTARPAEGGTTHARLSEVELELRSGRLADLFALAMDLHARVPLRLSTRSKADLGFALLTGRAPQAHAARPLGLSPVTTVAEAFRHIGRNGLSQLLDNEPALVAGSDPEALREMAAAVRRLDAAFGLFKSVVVSARGEGLKTDLRRLGAPLEEARTWERVQDRYILPLLHGADGPRTLAAATAGLRRTARIAALDTLASPRWTGWMLAFAAWLENGDWAEEGPFALPMTALAPRLLAERMERVQRAADVLEGADGVRNWGKLWRRTQRLRYAVDFCRALFPPDQVRPFRTAVEEFRTALKVAADADQALDLLDRLTRDGGRTLRDDYRPIRRHLRDVRAGAREELGRCWQALRAVPPPV